MSYFNRNKWWALAFLLLIALNIATLTAFWLLRDKRPGPMPVAQSGVVEFLSKELGFDSVQKEKLIQLYVAHQEKMQQVRKNNREAKDAFFNLLQKQDTPDSIIEKAAKEAAKYDSETDVLTFHHFQQIRNLCSETQKKKFDSVIQEVLRMIAPRPGRQQQPPPRREEGIPDGPPRDDERKDPARSNDMREPPPPK
ncbi:MAG: hypothetical protein ABIS69_03765 [Sediminibacterium sp.]